MAAVDLSADGQVTLVALARVDLREDRVVASVLIDGRLLPDGERRGVRLSPAGERIAYLRDGRLHVERIGGAARALTAAGVEAFAWRPDGRGLVAVVGEAARGERPRSDHERRTARLVAVGLDRRTTELTSGHDDRAPAVSPDGRWVAFARLDRDARGRDIADLWRVPLAGGDAEPLGTGLDLAISPSWSPDGERLACFGCAEPRLGPSDPGMRAWTLPATGGAAERVAPELELSVGLLPRLPSAAPGPAWLRSGELLFAVLDAGCVHLVAAGPDGVRTVVGGERQVLGYAAGGERLLIRETTPDQPGRAVLFPGRRVLASGRAAGGRVPMVRRRFGERDAWLLRPPNRDGPMPLLVSFHGGPHGFHGPAFPAGHLYRRVLASRGWLVLALNAVGSGSYSTAFADAILGRWGEGDLPEHLAAVDELVVSGEADPQRIAVAGFSYGGYLAAWAIVHDARFKAAVVGAPVADLRTMWATSDIGRWFVPYQMGGEPSELYDRLSAVTHAPKATAPTLILSGDADERCPIGQAQMLRASLGGPAELVTYPGGGHLFMADGRPSHRLDANRRIVEWLERWVGSAPP